MSQILDAHEERERLFARSRDLYVEALAAIVRARLGHRSAEPAEVRLARLMGETLALADLLGRRRVLLNYDDAVAGKPEALRAYGIVRLGETPIVHAPFEEAVADLLRREPRLADGWKEASRWYLEGGFSFARARKVGLTVTEKVQAAIVRLLRKGAGIAEAERVLREQSEEFSRAYADTVYRTTVSTAYSRAQQAEAMEPEVLAALPAWRYSAVDDRTTRGNEPDWRPGMPNHAAAHGFIAHKADSIWKRITPPNGFNCRCGLIEVDRWELASLGLIVNGGVKRFDPSGIHRFKRDDGFETMVG